MKLFIVTIIIAVASAAQLPSRQYLPPIQGSVEGSNLVEGVICNTGNRRPQQVAEKYAVILQQSQETDERGFRYSYETSNAIRAEEVGDSSQRHGGFSYTGDDGKLYSITYTAGEGGFRPQGAHLPVAPPIPEAILLALEQNTRDEAAGIFDDGQYHPGHYKPVYGSSSAAASHQH